MQKISRTSNVIIVISEAFSEKNHANWKNDSKNLDDCNLNGCSVFKSPFNELEDERKPRRELSWILRDIREPS